jgi:hypothetical protein
VHWDWRMTRPAGLIQFGAKSVIGLSVVQRLQVRVATVLMQ